MLVQTVSNYKADEKFLREKPKGRPFGQSLAPKPLLFHLGLEQRSSVSILDVGFGAGGLGRMIKENSATTHWAVDGIDGFLPNCVNESLIQSKLYRNIWHGDVRGLDSGFLASYDVVCMLDVIEHLDPESAKYAMRTLLNGISESALVFLSTPLFFMKQDSMQEGDLEEHLICVPATSILGLMPTMICLNEPLVAGVILTKRSLDYIELFQPISSRSFGYEQGKKVLERCGVPYKPLSIFRF
jgi:2-polyprenyl-3-methyl-5-hydroxy-6-metoxy-1,4-benzoquinol methylase